MFTVHGYVDGITYGCVVDPDVPEPDENDGIIVACAPIDALTLLRMNVGESVRTVGDDVTVSLTDPHGIVAGLFALTEVRAVTGDYTPVDYDEGSGVEMEH